MASVCVRDNIWIAHMLWLKMAFVGKRLRTVPYPRAYTRDTEIPTIAVEYLWQDEERQSKGHKSM